MRSVQMSTQMSSTQTSAQFSDLAASPTMRAAVYRRYGPPQVVQLEDVPRQRLGPEQVLIKIHATTVSSADWRMRSLQVPAGFGVFARPVFGMTGPRKKVLGSELSGVVVEVGRRVSRFKVGDEVFAFPGFELGCHAQLRVMHEQGRIALKPPSLSFEQAAALCFGGSTALHYLRDMGQLQPDQEVLILGASGAVGSAAVQIAAALGGRVTGVCSGANGPLVLGLGAHQVIDYAEQDPLDGSRRYDLIVDTVGAASPAQCLRALHERGRGLMCAASLGQIMQGAWASLTGTRQVLAGNAPERLEHLVTLRELALDGRFVPLIDSVYPLEQIVQAHERVQTGRKRGSVVVTIP